MSIMNTAPSPHTASERIVVQATAQEKRAITAKARQLDLPVAELMRRGAAAYRAESSDDLIDALADSAREAVERASAAIDESLDFVAASNARIALMEARPARTVRGKAA